jgi:hypothetical protein
MVCTLRRGKITTERLDYFGDRLLLIRIHSSPGTFVDKYTKKGLHLYALQAIDSAKPPQSDDPKAPSL